MVARLACTVLLGCCAAGPTLGQAWCDTGAQSIQREQIDLLFRAVCSIRLEQTLVVVADRGNALSFAGIETDLM